MPPKKKNSISAFTFSPIKPKKTEIIVQKPSKPSITPLQATNHTEGKKSFFISGIMDLKSSINDDHPHRQAERLIFDVLQQLQTMYNNAVKTFSLTVIIKKTTFETIENGLQQAYEHIKQSCAVNIKTESSVIENSIMNTLAQIQNSVVNLETKYNDIEAKVVETLKIYAEIMKSTSLKEFKIEQQTQRRKQRETLRQERQKYGVTLNLKNTKKPKSILSMSAKDIAERCQQAINRLYVNTSDSPRIIGVSKLAQSFRLQFETEEAIIVRKLNQTKDDIWNTAFEGLKIHVPMYGIVVHGIPIANLDPTTMDNTETIKQLEGENNMKPETIVKITPLRRRKNHDSVKLHHSIVELRGMRTVTRI